ncbi:MAG: SatD family protein [Bacteroidota bacterium]
MDYIILMADVVDSHNFEGKELMDKFQELVKFTNRIFYDAILSPLTITLGDEFQSVINRPSSAVAIVFAMEEWIIENEWNFKLRYVIVEGKIDTEINRKSAHEMLGEGLTTARKRLGDMKKESNRFFVSLKHELRSSSLLKVFRLAQYFIDSWQPKDRATVSGFLNGLDYKELAKKLGKDDSSVWRRRKSLAIGEYQTCKSLMEELING